ncbi:MAG: aldo/keto reductase [Catalinimonas sp.]
MTNTVPTTPLCDGGPHVSTLIWGLWRLTDWNLRPVELRRRVDHCLDRGITTFDHADIYGSYEEEEAFGRALAEAPYDRAAVQFVGKCGIRMVSPQRPAHGLTHYDTSAAHITRSVERSLTNLRTDYLDLLLLHRPDPLLDADEVAEAFDRLHLAGKVRHFGVSNFLPHQYDLLNHRLETPLVTNQLEFSASQHAAWYDGTLDHAQRLRYRPLAWSPLGGGALFQEESPLLSVLRAVGAELGNRTADQVALAWLRRHPSHPIPILGTGRLERIDAAVAALDLELSREQWFRIWTAAEGHGVP